MMKSKKYFVWAIFFGLCSSFLSVFMVSSRNEKSYSFDAVEALADTEDGYAEFCRCHSDGSCQLGNYISFRPSCGTLFSPEPFVPDCSALSSNCPSL